MEGKSVKCQGGGSHLNTSKAQTPWMSQAFSMILAGRPTWPRQPASEKGISSRH
jgi:hypothetical protein